MNKIIKLIVVVYLVFININLQVYADEIGYEITNKYYRRDGLLIEFFKIDGYEDVNYLVENRVFKNMFYFFKEAMENRELGYTPMYFKNVLQYINEGRLMGEEHIHYHNNEIDITYKSDKVLSYVETITDITHYPSGAKIPKEKLDSEKIQFNGYYSTFDYYIDNLDFVVIDLEKEKFIQVYEVFNISEEFVKELENIIIEENEEILCGFLDFNIENFYSLHWYSRYQWYINEQGNACIFANYTRKIPIIVELDKKITLKYINEEYKNLFE